MDASKNVCRIYGSWLILSIVIITAAACESRQSQQMRAELTKFGEHYRRISAERSGDVDWELLKEFESEFPEVASQIDKDLVVNWHEDVNADPANNSQRILAFSLFSAISGGPVLFLDGSVRHVSKSELDKLRSASEAPSKTRAVEMHEVTGRPYVDTPIKGLALALPDDWRWDEGSNAYMVDRSKAIIHIQLLDSDLESAELAVDMSLKRRNAGGVRKSAIQGKPGLYVEFFMQSGNPDLPREKVLSILLPRNAQTLQITASLPPTSKEIGLFRETILGCRWK